MSNSENRSRTPNPSAAALLVIDMQHGFSSTNTPIIPTVRSTISICRAANIPVVFIRHVDQIPHGNGHKGQDMIREFWPNFFLAEGTKEAEILPGLGYDEKDKVVVKHTYGGFYKTELEDWLEKNYKTEVIVTGVNSNVCCETTAREAFVRGFRVFFSTDATAADNAELHQAALKNMGHGFAYLVDCNILKNAFAPKV